MDTNPKVTVVIPTRNRSHILRRSIESVLAQTVRSLEVIVVDDASEDDTEGLVKGIHDTRLRYVKCQAHRGAPAARNTGIRLARGEYLAFQDSDDEWLPTKLERQLALMERHGTRAGVATCGTITVGDDGRSRISIAASERLSYEGLLSYGEPPWGGQTILVRQTPHTRRVLFDERLVSGQDWDYVVRLARITDVVSAREPLVRIGRATGERISTSLRKLQGTRLLREKYETDLRRYPRALIAHEARLGVLSISCGEVAAARRHLVNALRVNPFQPRLVGLFLWSFVRRPGVRSIFRRWLGGSRFVKQVLHAGH